MAGGNLPHIPNTPLSPGNSDTRAKTHGLCYRLTPSENQLAPLYVKGLNDIGPAMREFPEIRFVVADLGPVS